MVNKLKYAEKLAQMMGFMTIGLFKGRERTF